MVSAVTRQWPSVSVHELLQALNYHNLNDSFINLSEMKKRPKKMAHWNFSSILDFSVETRTDCKAI